MVDTDALLCTDVAEVTQCTIKGTMNGNSDYRYDPITKICQIGSVADDVDENGEPGEGKISMWKYCESYNKLF